MTDVVSKEEWCWSGPDEECARGPFASRDAALAHARDLCAFIITKVWVGRVVRLDPASAVPDINTMIMGLLIDDMSVTARKGFGFEDPGFDLDEGAEYALLLTLRKWANENVTSKDWRMADEHEEVVL